MSNLFDELSVYLCFRVYDDNLFIYMVVLNGYIKCIWVFFGVYVNIFDVKNKNGVNI